MSVTRWSQGTWPVRAEVERQEQAASVEQIVELPAWIG
jgi:hypothetical protein